jgi:hypothetical protein
MKYTYIYIHIYTYVYVYIHIYIYIYMNSTYSMKQERSKESKRLQRYITQIDLEYKVTKNKTYTTHTLHYKATHVPSNLLRVCRFVFIYQAAMDVTCILQEG